MTRSCLVDLALDHETMALRMGYEGTWMYYETGQTAYDGFNGGVYTFRAKTKYHNPTLQGC